VVLHKPVAPSVKFLKWSHTKWGKTVKKVVLDSSRERERDRENKPQWFTAIKYEIKCIHNTRVKSRPSNYTQTD